MEKLPEKINPVVNWFIEWTKLKVRLHIDERVFYFREKEIWWASLGANIGHEQNGKNHTYERPILILKKFNRHLLWSLPLTSKEKEGDYYFDLKNAGFESRIILSQLKLISSKRLIRKVGIIPSNIFLEIQQKLTSIILGK